MSTRCHRKNRSHVLKAARGHGFLMVMLRCPLLLLFWFASMALGHQRREYVQTLRQCAAEVGIARCADNAKRDLLEWSGLPTMDAMLRAYIIRSRVRTVENFFLARPYSPALFQQGNLPGPALLLKAQRGELREDELKKAWRRAEKDDAANKEERKNWPWSMKLPCRLCTNKNGGTEVCRPLSWFVIEQTRANGWNAISKGRHAFHFL